MKPETLRARLNSKRIKVRWDHISHPNMTQELFNEFVENLLKSMTTNKVLLIYDAQSFIKSPFLTKELIERILLESMNDRGIITFHVVGRDFNTVSRMEFIKSMLDKCSREFILEHVFFGRLKAYRTLYEESFW